MFSMTVILIPIAIMAFALIMAKAENLFVTWTPTTLTPDGDLNLRVLNEELQAQNNDQSPSSPS